MFILRNQQGLLQLQGFNQIPFALSQNCERKVFVKRFRKGGQFIHKAILSVDVTCSHHFIRNNYKSLI